MALKITVRAFRDQEAKVWVAESEDVPGLATEAPTMEELIHKLRVMIPELLSLNVPGPERGKGPSPEGSKAGFLVSQFVDRRR